MSTRTGCIIQLFQECGLNMRWWIANEAHSAELAIIISYPTSASGIIVLLKTPTKISMNLPDFILLEQTGKGKGLPLFTCHTSIKTVNTQTDWMNEKSKH